MKQLDRYLVSYDQLDALRESGRGNGIVLEILKFFPVLILAFLGEILLQYLILFAAIMTADVNAGFGNHTGILISLFSTLGMIIATMLCLRFAFRRKLSTAGFTKPFLSEYGIGLAAGFGVFALGVGIAVATGALTIDGVSDSFALGPWLVIFVGFLVQGMSEELLCRGCFLLNVARKNSVTAGILCNSLLFTALHLANNGITPLALVNLFLFGVFASLYYLWRGNIWGIAAFHSMWNFAQGNIFGILVSGGDFGVSLFSSTSKSAGTLINGGDFGLEGGLAVTAVMTLGILFILWRNVRRLANTPMPPEEEA